MSSEMRLGTRLSLTVYCDVTLKKDATFWMFYISVYSGCMGGWVGGSLLSLFLWTSDKQMRVSTAANYYR